MTPQPLRRAADDSVRFRLREATRAVHERLHRVEPFRSIAQRRLDRSGYVGLLGALHAFHAAVDAVLASDAETGPIAAQAGRLALLKLDLETLASGFGTGSGPVHTPPPAIASGPAAAAACLYVVHGSTLGGKLIHRQLDYLFGDQAAGRRFFAGTPHDAGLWRQTCQLIERQAPAEFDAMQRSANATFALFELCLEDAFRPAAA